MPGLDGETDHDQLCDDERRERDGHYVQELLLEQNQRPKHDHAR